MIQTLYDGRPKGIIPALSTPTTDDGELDEESLRSLVRHNIDWGAQGVAVSIVAGEFSKFSDNERKKCYEVVVDEAKGKVPIWAGISHLGTSPAIELARYAKSVGVDGIIAMPALLGKQAALDTYDHFSAILERVDLPMMIQDSEDFNGIHVCATEYARLAEQHDHLTSVKVEGPKSKDKIRDIRGLVGDRLAVVGGMAAATLFEELDLGAQGNIPGSCLTDLLAHAYTNYRLGQRDRAEEVFSRYKQWLNFGLLHVLSFTEVEKETLRLRHVIRSSNTRSPRIPLEERTKIELEKLLTDIGISCAA